MLFPVSHYNYIMLYFYISRVISIFGKIYPHCALFPHLVYFLPIPTISLNFLHSWNSVDSIRAYRPPFRPTDELSKKAKPPTSSSTSWRYTWPPPWTSYPYTHSYTYICKNEWMYICMNSYINCDFVNHQIIFFFPFLTLERIKYEFSFFGRFASTHVLLI